MVKCESEDNFETLKVYDAVYKDSSGELLWVERTENTEYIPVVLKSEIQKLREV